MTNTAALLCYTPKEQLINEIKQKLLLFDTVRYFFLSVDKQYLKMPEIVSQLEYFEEQNLVKGANFSTEAFVESLQFNLRPRIDGLELSRDQIRDLKFNHITRVLSNDLNARENMLGLYNVPILTGFNFPEMASSKKSSVINILINQFPIPNDSTPLEAVLDFKHNPDNLGRIAAIKKWVNKTVSSNLSEAEIKDEIDDLMYRYRKSLDIHKIKHHQGLLQSIIVGGAELLENVARLQFSKIAKGFFKLKEAKADLMQTEISAPGNELAYIYQAQQTFLQR